jgi:hypothetical protein
MIRGLERSAKRTANLNFHEIARQVGVKSTERELPNGRKIACFDWELTHVQTVCDIVKGYGFTENAQVVFSGKVPCWVLAPAVCACQPARPALSTPEGTVYFGTGKDAGKELANSSKLPDFTIKKRDNWTFVNFPSDAKVTPEIINSLIPPTIEPGSRVILSCDMPDGLIAKLAYSFAGNADCVGIKGIFGNVTIVASRNAAHPLGSIIAAKEFDVTKSHSKSRECHGYGY